MVQMALLTVRVEQKDGMSPVVTTVIIVYGMRSIKVGTLWNPVRIAVPECTRIICGVEHAVISFSMGAS